MHVPACAAAELEALPSDRDRRYHDESGFSVTPYTFLPEGARARWDRRTVVRPNSEQPSKCFYRLRKGAVTVERFSREMSYLS